MATASPTIRRARRLDAGSRPSLSISPGRPPKPAPVFSTRIGQAYCGDSALLMKQVVGDSSVDLIMTSPPFGLVRKKDYGNEDADLYVAWFEQFAEQFVRALKPRGSLVIDIGGAWKKGLPTRSLYHFELLLMLCRKFGFHLAQDFFWWNPAKLPTPAEWVNIRSPPAGRVMPRTGRSPNWRNY